MVFVMMNGCRYDWKDGRRCEWLRCTVHPHKDGSSVWVGPGTLRDLLSLGMLSGQALSDARSHFAQRRADRNAAHDAHQQRRTERRLETRA